MIRETHAIVIDESSTQLLRLEHWKEFESLVLGEEVARFQGLCARHHVIGLDANPEVGHLP